MVDKKAAIFNTTLKLLVERGFYATPMSEIAKQSGVSVGIIYHYFESKDDLIRQLYADIKNKFSSVLIQGEPHLLESLPMLKHIWFNAYHYCLENPTEILFLEQYENSPYHASWVETSGAWDVLVERFEREKQTGLYIDIPLIIFYDMNIKVAMSVAKRQISGTVQLDQTALEIIADAVCRSFLA